MKLITYKINTDNIYIKDCRDRMDAIYCCMRNSIDLTNKDIYVFTGTVNEEHNKVYSALN